MNISYRIKWISIFFLFGGFFPALSAQHPAIEEEPSVQHILEQYITEHHEMEKTPGWRVLVLSTRDRRDMERKKRAFERTFPSIDIQWEYRDPNYRMYAGAFRDRLDVHPLLMKIKKKFPQAVEVKDDIPLEEYLNQYEAGRE